MSTDIFDEHHFKSQCSLYETNCVQLNKESVRCPAMSAASHNRRVKYSTQATTSSSASSTSSLSSSHITTNSIHNRHSTSNDLLSLIRSFAKRPFKTSSMANAVAEGQTSNVIGDTPINNKHSVNLLRYRPLSDVLTDHTSYTQSTHAVEEFLERMGWPMNGTADEARVKWNTAMKFLIPVKFDVTRAIDLYKTHQNLRKEENLNHISINNSELIQEIQSSKFFSLPQIPLQPLIVVFTASNFHNSTTDNSISRKDQEILTLRSLICQLDVATESIDVQQNGINFIYDMKHCSASQFDINLSKKILKLLQGGYPAMVKNIFVISAPKWFRVVYKVTLYSTEQMFEYLTREYGYSSDNIPISLGGTFNPIQTGHIRYQMCLSKVTNNKSICYSYYSSDYEEKSKKLFNHHSNDDKSMFSSNEISSSPSLVTFASLRSKHTPSTLQNHDVKCELSLLNDNDKRRRSNESLIEEESPNIPSFALLRKENLSDQIKHNENKRLTSTNTYRALTEKEFLSKTPNEIKQEFRKLPNPPAHDVQTAKNSKNLDKNRYRDVLPGELTRVILQPDIDDDNDYINANYVSGYNNQQKAYIFTQGPLQTTIKDFWRMIWQENISIIVMTTNIRESGTIKCFPYWPLETNECLRIDPYEIENEKFDKYDSFIITKLILKKKNHSNAKIIYHAHYLKWPDHGVPTGTKDALLFLEKIDYYRQLTAAESPVLLHCSAGIGRTGTFCAIDIGIKQYLNEKLINIPTTVIDMRHERAGSVQTEDQYLFAHLALMDFIKQYKHNNRNSKINDCLINQNLSIEQQQISLQNGNGINKKIRK